MAKRYSVNKLSEAQPHMIADHWRGPLVIRLLQGSPYSDGESPFSFNHRVDGASGEVESGITLSWSGLGGECTKCANSYQAPVLTEHAALAIACVMTRDGPDVEISEVTLRGDKADYWLNGREQLLEVSGQQRGNLEALRDEKRDQLLENPYGKPGYVCVADFATRRSYLWHYPNPGEGSSDGN